MIDENKFVGLAALICEPARAKMLWALLDGNTYTASELSVVADVSFTSTSNHLNKLLAADLIRVEARGKYRYFSFSRPEVAYAVEALANLAKEDASLIKKNKAPMGIKYCRSCYDHLAGEVGVKMIDALVRQKLIARSEMQFEVTAKGWRWFGVLGIDCDMMKNNRRPVARQCLDWTERKPHLAGQLGALLLQKMLDEKWFKRVKFSRELLITGKGSKEMYDRLKIKV